MKPTPIDQLSDDARRLLDQLLESYLDQVGHPPSLPRETAKTAIMSLLERGEAVFVPHGNPGEWRFTLELTDRGGARHAA